MFFAASSGVISNLLFQVELEISIKLIYGFLKNPWWDILSAQAATPC